MNCVAADKLVNEIERGTEAEIGTFQTVRRVEARVCVFLC